MTLGLTVIVLVFVLAAWRSSSSSSSTLLSPVPPPATTSPERCAGARHAVAHYRARTHEWQAARRLADRAGPGPRARGHSCHWARYAVGVWRARARAARAAFEAWRRYHFDWRAWLPDVWQRLGACETGYGRRPGNWGWDSGTYVSAFGIFRPGYADDARAVGLPAWDDPGVRTPREQYETALSHHRRHGGFSGWGCRGA